MAAAAESAAAAATWQRGCLTAEKQSQSSCSRWSLAFVPAPKAADGEGGGGEGVLDVGGCA